MTTFTRTNGKKSITRRIATMLASIAFIGMLSGTASAAPIIGSLEYNGLFTPTDGSVVVSLATATYLDFYNPTTIAIGDGHFASMGGFGTLHLFDFFINPFAAPTPVWTDATLATDLTFTLTSLVIVDQGTTGAGDHLVLNGRGLFTQTGFDDTDAVWSLTAQDAGGSSPILTFSASSAVSEPSMLTLLGLTMLGMGWARRSKRRKLAA